MKFLRWALGLVMALWAVMNGLNIGMTALYKLGKLPPLPPAEQRLEPLMAATPWWMLGLWTVIFVLLVRTAWRLFRDGKALGGFLLALVLHLVMWWFMHAMPAYQAAFTPMELKSDYVIFAVEALVAVLIWLSERRKPA